MSLRRQAIQGGLWSAAERWSGQLLSTAIFLILARLLSPEDFGLVALATALIGFAGVLVQGGFAEAIVQREDLQKGHLDTAFWSTLLLACALAGATFFAAPFLARWLGQAELEDIVRVLSPVFLLVALSSTQNAILRRNFQFKSLSIRTLFATLVGGVIGIGCALAGLGAWSLVAQRLAGSLVGVLVLWWASTWRPGLGVSLAAFKDLFSFGVNVTGISVLTFLNRWLDRLLIGAFLGPAALGYYTIAKRFTEMADQLLVRPITSVAFPTFSRIQSDRPRFRAAYYRMAKVTAAVATPVFIGIILVAPDFIPVAVGSKWETSIPVLQLLAGVGVLRSLTSLAGPSMLALGYGSAAAGLLAANTLANVIGFAAAVSWGIVAVAGAFLVRALALAPLPFWFLHRHLGLEYPRLARQLAGVTGALLLMVAACFVVMARLSESPDWLRLLATVGVGAVVYAVGLLLLDRGLLKEVGSLFKRK